MEEKKYLALLHTIGFSHRKLHEIFSEKQNYKDFYESISVDILIQYKYTEKQISIILERKKQFTIQYIEKKIQERNVEIITVFDEQYPQGLLHISQVPFVLYLRGRLDSSQKFSVVGARRISSYGIKIIEKLIPDLSKYFTIVSGGAAGCDTIAHKVCLQSGGKTISVIGTGIDQDYPTGNIKLYAEIVKNGGAVISMFPISEVGNPYNFPIRNEIVAGLSHGTLVVEAQEKSGTLITAQQCLDLGKDLFAIPGDIFLGNSIGCNKLIQSNAAKLVLTSVDILEEYNISISSSNRDIYANKNKTQNISDDIEKSIYNLLLLEKMNINEISKKIGLDIRTLGFKLSMLEIAGLVKKSLSGDYEIQ
ncbi:MAG: DNA-protecting protein DprA [Candidatus Gracilibacteria bacterium]|nr:DNA-protecting protein DprA [Candidatus Gracilibacteria bacterium]